MPGLAGLACVADATYCQLFTGKFPSATQGSWTEECNVVCYTRDFVAKGFDETGFQNNSCSHGYRIREKGIYIA